jgi:hypothetical protein
MTQDVSSTIVIDLPRHEAWQKLRDISLAHHYVPGIIDTRIVTEITEGVGASRYVYRSSRSWIQETVEEWHEGEGFLIRLHKGEKPAPPFKASWFRYQFSDAGPDQTRFTATLSYELPWGGLGRWLEPRISRFVQGIIDDIVCSMKLYYETGQPTTPAALRAFKRQQNQ